MIVWILGRCKQRHEEHCIGHGIFPPNIKSLSLVYFEMDGVGLPIDYRPTPGKNQHDVPNEYSREIGCYFWTEFLEHLATTPAGPNLSDVHSNRNKKLRTGLLASLLGARTLLEAPGRTTRSKFLLVTRRL